jgi:hypothetical protein
MSLKVVRIGKMEKEHEIMEYKLEFGEDGKLKDIKTETKKFVGDLKVTYTVIRPTEDKK